MFGSPLVALLPIVGCSTSRPDFGIAGGEGGSLPQAEVATSSEGSKSRPCKSGTWDDDDDAATTCVAWTECEPGEFAAEAGSDTVDRQCAPCEAGAFSDKQNAESCQAWSVCKTGTIAEGSAEADRNCASPIDVVTAGDGFSCALRRSGEVLCWGDNQLGQLGNGQTQGSATPSAVLAKLSGSTLVPLDGVRALSAGRSHACAVRDDGSVWCWGENASNSVSGVLSLPDEAARVAVRVAGVDQATDVAAGDFVSCAVLEDTSVKCWGATGYLGAGQDNTSSLASVVDPANNGALFRGVVRVDVGYSQICALVETVPPGAGATSFMANWPRVSSPSECNFTSRLS